MAKRKSTKKTDSKKTSSVDPTIETDQVITEETTPAVDPVDNDTTNVDLEDSQSSTEYVGPNYKSHIIMYPNDKIDPRSMSPDEIEATIKKYPRTEAWWKK